MEFTFFRTKKRDPRYIDDAGCEEFASCSLSIDMSEVAHLEIEKRGVTLYIKFGETELHVRAVLNATGTEKKSSFRFSAR